MEANSRYEEFLTWHAAATERLQAGESLAEPSDKFYQNWLRNRVEAEAAKKAVYVD